MYRNVAICLQIVLIKNPLYVVERTIKKTYILTKQTKIMATKRFDHVFVTIFTIWQLCVQLPATASSNIVLSKSIEPKQYDLAISIETNSLSYSVNETVHLNIQEISQNISFHSASALKINWTDVNLTCGQQKLAVKSWKNESDIITLFSEKDIPIGKCTLEMNFVKKMSLKETDGIYVSPNR